MLVWLSLDEPRHRDVAAINEVLDSVSVPKLVAERFHVQAEWLARHAGVEGGVHVGQEINAHRLDIAVSSEAISALTQCSKGNAVYDPVLDAIFVDEYLLFPSDVVAIGTDSASVMSSQDELDFVVPIVSFILAHELGHRQRGNPASAFFSLGAMVGDDSAVKEELAADDFAIKVLAQAYGDPSAPSFLQERNALAQLGLDIRRLEGSERAAADVLGAMRGLSMLMQFASGPYSPFYRDASHPTFLERAFRVANQLSVSSTDLIAGQAPVLLEEMRRLKMVGALRSIEILASEPIARVRWDGNTTLVATRTLVQAPEERSLEQVFEFDASRKDGGLLLLDQGYSAEEELPGTWLEEHQLFSEESNRAAGTGTRNVPFDKWSANGLVYEDEAWAWRVEGRERSVKVEAVHSAARAIFSAPSVEAGAPMVTEDGVVFPILTGANRFTALLLEGGNFVKAPRPYGIDQTVGTGYVDIEGARWLSDRWFVPAREHDEHADTWEAWMVAPGEEPVFIASAKLLSSHIGPSGEASFGRTLDPIGANVVVIAPDSVLLWYENDSVWYITPAGARLVFHPAFRDLQVTPTSEQAAIFWVHNSKRAYWVDFAQQG